MPGTVNGIGTIYVGSYQEHRYYGKCDHCKAQGELRSYHTSLYFAVLYLPLVPLGRKRILNYCPRCSYHYAISLKEWEKQRREDIGAAAAKLRDEPSAEHARAALQAVVTFDDEKELRRLGALLRQQYAGEVSVLAHLGAAYEHYGLYAEAEEALRAALALQDDPEIRRLLVVVLLTQGRPDEARALLLPIPADVPMGQLGLYYLLVEGYQAVGRHDQALDVLKQIAAAMPDQASDREYTKYVKESTKRVATRKPIKREWMVGPQPRRQGRRTAPLWPALVGPGLVLALLLVAGAIVGRNTLSQHVWLISGLPRPYQVSVGDRQFHVKPFSRELITLPLGRHELTSRELWPAGPAPQVELAMTFRQRLFGGTTFVLNPDQVALLAWSQVRYSVNPSPNDENPYELHVGQPLYRFGRIDFPFVAFPEEIKLQNGKSANRTGLDHLQRYEGMALLSAGLGRLEDPAARAQFAELLVDRFPDETVFLRVYCATVPPEQALAKLETGLDRRPLNLEWHRAYQDLAERQPTPPDLLARYRRYLKETPDDGVLLYLLARVTDDHAAAARLLQRAAAAQPPCLLAFTNLGTRLIGEGRLKEARELLEQGRRITTDDPFLNSIYTELLLQEHDYQGALRLLGEAVDDDLARRARRIELAVRANPRQLDPMLLATPINDGGEEPEEPPPAQKGYLQAVAAHARQDNGEFATLAGQCPEFPELAFHAALLAGDLPAVRGHVAAEHAETAATASTLLYIAAQRAGQATPADRAAAVAELEKTFGLDPRYAHWLAGTAKPDLPWLLAAPLSGEHRLLLLAALGVTYPELRDDAFAALRRLATDPAFPCLFYRQLAAGK